MLRPKIVGIAGSSAAGKTTLCNILVEKLAKMGVKAYRIGMDQFYKTKPANISPADWNWDDPANIDNEDICNTLDALHEGLADPTIYGFTSTINGLWVPDHDYVNFRRIEMAKVVPRADIYLFEGVFALQDAEVRARYDYSIYIDCDEQVVFDRRVERDIRERGRTLDYIVANYKKYVLPAYLTYVKGSAKWANIVVKNNNNWDIANLAEQVLPFIC